MRLVFASENHEQIGALYDWLRADGGVARSAKVAVAEPSDPASMGGLEALDVILTHLTGAANLALATTAWFRSRSRPAPVTIARPDGAVLTIGGDSEVTSDLIVRFLSAEPEQADESS